MSKPKKPKYLAIEHDAKHGEAAILAEAHSLAALKLAVIKDTQQCLDAIMLGDDKSLLFVEKENWSNPVYLVEVLETVKPYPVVTAKAKLMNA